jgi:hypothetical protein
LVERQMGNRADMLDTGQGAELGFQIDKAAARRETVANRQLECEHMTWFEPRPDLFHFGEAPGGEGCTGHQHETQRNLTHDEGRPSPTVKTAEPSPAAGAQRGDEIQPEALNSRYQTEDQGRRHRG